MDHFFPLFDDGKVSPGAQQPYVKTHFPLLRKQISLERSCTIGKKLSQVETDLHKEKVYFETELQVIHVDTKAAQKRF